MAVAFVQAAGSLQVAILCGPDVPDTRFANVPPRYNAARAIGQNHDTGERSLDLLRWGLVPYRAAGSVVLARRSWTRVRPPQDRSEPLAVPIRLCNSSPSRWRTG